MPKAYEKIRDSLAKGAKKLVWGLRCIQRMYMIHAKCPVVNRTTGHF